MDFESIARSIWNQFVTVWNAPVPFIAALLVVGYFVWKAVQWQHGVRIAHLTSQLELYREATTLGAASAAPGAAAEEEVPKRPEPGPRPPAAPKPAKESATEPEPRVFLDDTVSLKTLRELSVTGGTTIAGQLAAEPYVGKWMRLEGKVRNVSASGRRMVMVTLQGDQNVAELPRANLIFRDDLERISAFEVGQLIKAIGRFERLTPISLMFGECELLEP